MKKCSIYLIGKCYANFLLYFCVSLELYILIFYNPANRPVESTADPFRSLDPFGSGAFSAPKPSKVGPKVFLSSFHFCQVSIFVNVEFFMIILLRHALDLYP